MVHVPVPARLQALSSQPDRTSSEQMCTGHSRGTVAEARLELRIRMGGAKGLGLAKCKQSDSLQAMSLGKFLSSNRFATVQGQPQLKSSRLAAAFTVCKAEDGPSPTSSALGFQLDSHDMTV